jgi:hypothetical protein
MFRSAGTNYFDWASGQTLAFGTQTSQGGAGRVSKVNFLDSGDLTNVTGNFVVGTAGKGIDFSANTHAAGMTSELLNDYEEGTFTATLTGFSSAPTTPITSTSRYTKVGRTVTVQIAFRNVDTTGASGAILVQGLPYAAGADAVGAAAQSGMSSTNVAAGLITSGASTVELIGAVAFVNLSFTAGAGQYLFVNITYTV